MATLAETWGTHEAQFWLRGEVPDELVHFDPAVGVWNVYGYPEVVQVLTDPKSFTSDLSHIVPETGQFSEGNLVQMDPPEHTKLRKLVSHAFSAKVMAALEPRIAAVTHELLDAVAGEDKMELVSAFANPLPAIVIAELLGIPGEDHHIFRTWVDNMMDSLQGFSLVESSEEQERNLKASFDNNTRLTNYLTEHVVERRRRPREDMLSKLVQAEVDGERLSEEAVVNFSNILLVAGHITATMLLGNTVLCLDAHPEHFARVRADRSALPAAIEESLRFLSPFALLGRATTKDVEIGGQPVPAGQVLAVWTAAANRDARQFPDPHVFDPTRGSQAHLSFGRGVHFCIGAPLARLEGRIALNILLDRFPDLRVDPDQRPEFMPSPHMTGVRKLPLLLGPRS